MRQRARVTFIATAALTMSAHSPLATAQAVPTLNVAQIVASVDAVNARTTTLSADFTAAFFAKAYNVTQRSSGHVDF
jgi:hypothetical protein